MKNRRQTVAWDKSHAYYRKRDLYLKDIQAKLVTLRIRSGFIGSVILLLINSISDLSSDGVFSFKMSNNLLWNTSRVFSTAFLVIIYLFIIIRIFKLSRKQNTFFIEELGQCKK